MPTSDKLLALCDLLDKHPTDELLSFFQFLDKRSISLSDIASPHREEIEKFPEEYATRPPESEEWERSERHLTKKLMDKVHSAKLGSSRELSESVVQFLMENLIDDKLLDAYFTRQELGMIPGIVTRWKELQSLHLVGLPEDPRIIAYLRQATTCYLYGLPSAAVILCRAILEFALIEVIPSQEGPPLKPNQKPKLEKLIDRARNSGLLTPEMKDVATSIRLDGNDAIHSRTFNEAEALSKLRQTREVLQHLYKVPQDH